MVKDDIYIYTHTPIPIYVKGDIYYKDDIYVKDYIHILNTQCQPDLIGHKLWCFINSIVVTSTYFEIECINFVPAGLLHSNFFFYIFFFYMPVI